MSEAGNIELFLDRNMEMGELRTVPGGIAGVYSHRSPHKETPNEDSAMIAETAPDGVVLAVADGVGGLNAGENASRLALRELGDAVSAAEPEGDALRSAIITGFERANEAVVKLGIGAATTLAAVLVQGRVVRTFHVGDSMILVVGQRGRVKLQTISHSPVGYALEAGVLDEEEAMHHDDRHIISNMVGTAEMRIEIGPAIEMAARDTLIVASDGVFDNLLVDEVVERIRKGRLDRVVSVLAGDCLRRMSTPEDGQPSKADDLTFIAFRLESRKKR